MAIFVPTTIRLNLKSEGETVKIRKENTEYYKRRKLSCCNSCAILHLVMVRIISIGIFYYLLAIKFSAYYLPH